MKNIILLLVVVFSNLIFASPAGDQIEKFVWNDIDVVYLEDNKAPIYNVSVYFADGALSDNEKVYGETEVMFEQLFSGTDRYTQEQLADSFEFFGSGFSTAVTHENSTLSVSGLAKDVSPALKLVCHIMRNAIFPEAELKKYKTQIESGFKNLATNHAALADRAFRKLSLANTPFANHVGGYLHTIKKITPRDLAEKLDYFNNKVKKRIYINGPRSILPEISKIINLDCQWKGEKEQVVRVEKIDVQKLSSKSNQKSPKIYLIPVPQANQAQIRIGRYLDHNYTRINFDLLDFSNSLLGDGFTSLLMQNLRVKNGLTYGVYSYAGLQKTYGRAGVSTSTKSETVFKIIDETKKVLSDSSKAENLSEDMLTHVKNYLSGSYLFKFEKTSSYLGNIAYFDHVGRKYTDMFDFPENIKKFKANDVSGLIGDVFNFDQQTIVVVGDKSVKSQLQSLGNVEVLDYTKFY